MIAIVGGAGDAAAASGTVRPASVASGVCAAAARGRTNTSSGINRWEEGSETSGAFFSLHILAEPPERVCPSSGSQWIIARITFALERLRVITNLTMPSALRVEV